MSKLLTKLSTSLFAITAAQGAYAQTSDTQTPPAEERSRAYVDDIVVTATRQETNLQSTPLAITALAADDLERSGLTNVAEASRVVPNVTFERIGGAYGPGMTAFIRGVGTGDSNLAGEPGVAFYIDDVYYPLVFGSMFDLLDLERVEILRGPQGTLFGRNSLAGAVNLVTKGPQLDEPSAYVEVTVGNYDRREVAAGFNMPLNETMAISVSTLSRTITGYQKRLDFRCEMIRRGTPELAGTFPTFDPSLLNHSDVDFPDDCTIGHLGGEDVQAVRGQFLWEPTSRLSMTLSADYLDDESDGAMDTVVDINPAVAAARTNMVTLYDTWTAPGGPTFAYDERFITGDPYTTYATFADPIAPGTTIPGNTFYNGSPYRGGVINPANSPQVNWGLSGKVIYELADDIDLIGVVGYRNYEGIFSFDVDGGPVVLENNRNDVEQDDWTAELRLTGQREWIDWVAGLFYYSADGVQRFSGSSPFNGTLRYLYSRYTPESKAAFANVTLRPFGDRLSINLGGRYSDDKKPVEYRSVLDGTNASSTEFVILPTGQTIFAFDIEADRFDWKAGMDYQLADRTMIYASVATGAKLPGFNSRPLQPSQVAQFDGDETQSYELGVKTDLFDRKLRVNAVLFYTDYKTRPSGVSGQEYQLGPDGMPNPGGQIEIPHPTNSEFTTCRNLTAQEITDGVPGYTCIGRTFYENTPGEVKGFEVETEFRPIDGLSLGGSVGYHKFSAPDLEARPEGQNKRLNAIPEWTANAGIQYEFILPSLGGTITPRLDWFYTGSQVYNPTFTEYNQDAYSLVNARVTYNNDEHDFSISLGATNLFDNFYWRNYFVYQSIGWPQVNGQPGTPREWYLTISKKF